MDRDFNLVCTCMQSSSAASMDAVLEVLSKQPSERTPEDVGKSLTRRCRSSTTHTHTLAA